MLLEAREATSSAFVEGMDSAPASTAPPAGHTHPGTEVHNHFKGILRAEEIVDALFDGNWQAALRDLHQRFGAALAETRADVARRRAALRDLLSMAWRATMAKARGIN